MMTIRQVINFSLHISLLIEYYYLKNVLFFFFFFQGLAILLSCLVYHHHVTIIGIIGILLVFGSVFLRIYCNNRLRAIRRRRAAANSIKD